MDRTSAAPSNSATPIVVVCLLVAAFLGTCTIPINTDQITGTVERVNKPPDALPQMFVRLKNGNVVIAKVANEVPFRQGARVLLVKNELLYGRTHFDFIKYVEGEENE